MVIATIIRSSSRSRSKNIIKSSLIRITISTIITFNYFVTTTTASLSLSSSISSASSWLSSSSSLILLVNHRIHLMVRWVVGSILHGVDPLSYFSFQQVLHDWFTKSRGMCYPFCVIMHIKYSLLLMRKSIPCSGVSGFPLSLSGLSFIICPTPYNRKMFWERR